jgi:hypothetical protein
MPQREIPSEITTLWKMLKLFLATILANTCYFQKLPIHSEDLFDNLREFEHLQDCCIIIVLRSSFSAIHVKKKNEEEKCK